MSGQRREAIRIISLAATSLLCGLLASDLVRTRASSALLKKKPTVELQASKTLIIYPCAPDSYSASRSCPSNMDAQVALTATAKGFKKQTFYAYTVTGGRVVGEGSKVVWELTGVWPGVYVATVEVRDNKKHRALSSVTLKIGNCSDCIFIEYLCPTIVVTCYDEVTTGTPITCKAAVSAGRESNRITYEWSARDSSGEDLSGRISGRGTSISISTNGLAGRTVYTRVEVKGLDPSCSTTASSSTVVKP